MVMALAESGCRSALPFIEGLAHRRPELPPMVRIALGDALVRLGRATPGDSRPVLDVIAGGDPSVIHGAFRAVAMLQLRLDARGVAAIVEFASALQADDPLRLWVAAASAGWKESHVRRFLDESAKSAREDIRAVAETSLNGIYRRWSPL